MSNNMSEWELSKENICPLPKGRKTGMLRLSEQPVDELTSKRKLFEHQLRVYEGDDPLSIWCDYIKWVEQSYPKGGKEGNIGNLIQQCLKFFKEETMYQDDKRFIDIWLKFANICVKPSEVYFNMHSRNIGCKTARFFIAWAWEMEQLGNFKRADEILLEGIHRRADPIQDLKTEHSRLEMKMAAAFASEAKEQNLDDRASRAAFSVLKKQEKNKAPVMRVGSMAHPATKENLTIGYKQPQPKNNNSKMPFSIYSAENQPVSKSNCSEGAMFAITNENLKENERKPSKWTKVKATQAASAVVQRPKMPSFTLHEDNTPQPCSTKKNPVTNQALTTWKNSSTPPVALFEPPDPMKRPMYNRIKVYGGVEEFSFEEIRAAVWWEKKRKLDEEEKRLAEEKKMNDVIEHVRRLEERIEMLQTQVKCKETYSTSKTAVPSDNKSVCEAKYTNVKEPKENLQREEYTSSKLSLHEDCSLDVPHVENKLNSTTKSNKTKYCLNSSRVEMPTNVISEVMSDLFNATSSRLDHSNTSSNSKGNSLLETSKNSVPKLNMALEEGHSLPSSSLPKPLFPVMEEETEKKYVPFTIFQDSATRDCVLTEQTESNSLKEVPDQDENAAPSDYVQACEKRELAGILQPSKNIPFIPLEEQLKELEEDGDEEMDDKVFPDSDDQCNDNYTMIPPSDTMQFAHFAKFASTPCEKPAQKACSQYSKVNEMLDSKKEIFNLSTEPIFKDILEILKRNENPRIEEIVRNAMESINAPDMSDKNFKVAYYNLQSCLGLTECKILKSAITNAMSEINLTEAKNGNKSVTMAAVLPSFGLSTIMETSREFSAKSSSSSSSSSHSISSIQKYKTSMSAGFKKPLEISLGSLKEVVPLAQEIKTYCTDMNPFDSKFTDSLLQTLPNPATSRNIFFTVDERIAIKTGYSIMLGSINCVVEELYAEGAYAKVYLAKPVNTDLNLSKDLSSSLAVKACLFANAWEFYICSELQDRISDNSGKFDVSEAVIKILCAVGYRNGIVLISSMYPYGSLLNIVNVYKQCNSSVPEVLVLYFTLEMLMVMSRVHECNIVHGDIKPDNFVLSCMPEKLDRFNKAKCLCLIDFGRAIDLSFFEPGITFKTCVTTDFFTCIEMGEGKPWVHQPDWYGIMGSIHVLLFGSYMTVERDTQNFWKPVLKFKRYWQTDIWEPLFKNFLNMPGCYNVPDVKPFIDAIALKLKNQESTFLAKSQGMCRLLNDVRYKK